MCCHDLEVMSSWVRTLVGSNLGCLVLLSKVVLEPKISIAREPVHLKSPQTSKIMWQYISILKSLMAKWLQQVSQWHEMCCHDLEVMSSNSGRVELEVLSAFVLSHTWTKNINIHIYIYMLVVMHIYVWNVTYWCNVSCFSPHETYL